MKKLHSFFLIVLSLFPIFSFAAAFTLGVDTESTFKDTIYYVLEIIRILIPIMEAVAFIIFFWGMSKFLLNSGKPEEIKTGRSYMIWGVLALFVMLSFMAIIKFISKDLELGNDPNVPSVLLPTSPR